MVVSLSTLLEESGHFPHRFHENGRSRGFSDVFLLFSKKASWHIHSCMMLKRELRGTSEAEDFTFSLMSEPEQGLDCNYVPSSDIYLADLLPSVVCHNVSHLVPKDGRQGVRVWCNFEKSREHDNLYYGARWTRSMKPLI